MNTLPSTKEIKVSLDFGNIGMPVGRLALRDRIIYFEYDRSFIERGLEISPLRLPLKPDLSNFENNLFEGLPGVFNDSLPDGWGRLLFDRYMQSHGIVPREATPLHRLAYVGKWGMGALVYEPMVSPDKSNRAINLDDIALQAQSVLEGSSEEVLKELLSLNASSSGARPKAMVEVSENYKQIIHGSSTATKGFEPWLIKFPTSFDGPDAGAIEYVYAHMAKAAGIEMSDFHLFPAAKGSGYFGSQRFDREGPNRLHMHSASGLLHADYRAPSLDYTDLLALTQVLTRDVREVEKMYRLAVFNVLAYNRDDHAKNFSFLMDRKGQWKLSPAYDLTFSSGPGGEQSTMVMGEGRNPGVDHLLKLGSEAQITKLRCKKIIDQTQTALQTWPSLARQYGVGDATGKLIAKRLGVNG